MGEQAGGELCRATFGFLVPEALVLKHHDFVLCEALIDVCEKLGKRGAEVRERHPSGSSADRRYHKPEIRRLWERPSAGLV